MQRRYLSDHLDGERLPPWRALWVRFHLRFCQPCIRYHRSLGATREALRGLRDRDVGSDDHR